MGLEDGQSNADMSDEQMDTLINGKSEPAGIQETPKEIVEPQSWKEDTLKVNGKEVKGTREQILQWASMGYNYPQRAQELKTQQDMWEKQRQEKENYWRDMEQKLGPYMEVDKYAIQNKDWWEHVQAQFKQKIAQAETNPEVAALKAQLEEVKSFIDSTKAEKTAQQIEQEDKQLASEIDSVRKSFPNIDFTTPDAEGKSLEMKVLDHAQGMGLDGSKPGHFRAAFRDFYHEQLVGKAEETGKEKVAKELQNRTKLGILGQSSKPTTKGLSVATNVKAKSYNDLVQEALSELNQGA